MVRKILLGGIMLASVLIIVVSVEQRRGRDNRPVDNQTLVPPQKKGVRLIKYGKNNEPVLIVTGMQAVQPVVKGPIEITQPKLMFPKDKNSPTTVTADLGHFEGQDKDKIDQGYLEGHVVMTVEDKNAGDNTVITCERMEYDGATEQGFIPGAVVLRNRSMEVTGSQLTVGAGLASAKLEKDVKLVLKDIAQNALSKLTETPAPGPAAVKPNAPPAELTITSGGMMTYQRDASRATFEKQVVAEQGKSRVSGDSMVVEFGKNAEEPAAGGGSAMNIRRVVVRSDKKEGVVVDSPDRQAWGDRMEFDGVTGLVVFGGAPCRIVQKSGKEDYRLEGNEIRFGRQGVLGPTEKLPEGMAAGSQKMLITGEPARVASVGTEAGQSSVLVAKRVLLDQETKVVWLEGDEKQPASAEQGKNHVTGREVVFSQKTETHGEKVLGRGPGRLEVPSGTPQPGQPAQTTVVTFGEAMSYLPENLRAEFTGGVRVVDGATTCLSKTLTVDLVHREGPGSREEMKRMVASGGVSVTGENRSAKAETLVYSFPTSGSTLYVATLRAKPGETCEIKSGGLLTRSGMIEMTETPLGGGKTTLRAKSQGKGYIFYQPTPNPDGTKGAGEPFEVRYEKLGTFDDAAGEAVFDGNVRVKRPDMNLDAGHVVMNFVKGTTGGSRGRQGSESLDLSVLTAADNVTLRSGPADDLTTATGKKFVWRRATGATELAGGEGEKEWARVVRDKSSIEAPLLDVVLKNNEIERVLTKGGGRLKGQSRVRQGSAGPKKLQGMEVTWSQDGAYRTFHPADPRTEATAEARVGGNVKAFSEDADLTAESLTVFFGPEAQTQEPDKLKLEARTVITKGDSHAKMFMPEGNYYRYARGDSLEWDRLGGRMVVTSETSDAVVWDNSNEWTGKRLVVNQTREGRVEAESTSGRRITFYEEGTPRGASEDAREWKPIY